MLPDCQASKFYKHSGRGDLTPRFLSSPAFLSLRGCTRITPSSSGVFLLHHFVLPRMNGCAITTTIDLGQTHQPDSLGTELCGQSDVPTHRHVPNVSRSRPGQPGRKGKTWSRSTTSLPFHLEEEGEGRMFNHSSVSFFSPAVHALLYLKTKVLSL